jgi:hypothetical protein
VTSTPVICIGAASLLVLATLVYAMLTAEPGRHRAPKPPLRDRLGAMLRPRATPAQEPDGHAPFPGGVPTKLGGLPVKQEEAGRAPDTIHVRPTLDGHVRETPGGGLHVVPIAAGAQTLTDMPAITAEVS